MTAERFRMTKVLDTINQFMKQKTKKAASKRFKITLSGKILRGHQMTKHLKANKSRSARVRYKQVAYVSDPEKKAIKRLMPYN